MKKAVEGHGTAQESDNADEDEGLHGPGSVDKEDCPPQRK